MSSRTDPVNQGHGARLQQVWQDAKRGRLDDALAGSDGLTRAAPEFPEAWFAASYIRLRCGYPEEALEAIERATELRPDDPAWQLQELLCLDACNLRGRAIELGTRLLKSEISELRYFATLGQVLFDLQQYEAARSALQRAIAADESVAPLQLALARCELALGNLGAAAAACERSLALDHAYAEALHFRSTLLQRSSDANHIAELRRLLERPPASPRAHSLLLYALARELEELGEYEESFSVLVEAGALYRKTLDFDLESERAFLGAIPAAWTPEAAAAAATASLPADASRIVPIFVVGLPRSGTTLVERILGAHSLVTSAGELPDFSRHLSRMIEAMPGAAEHDRAGLVEYSARVDFPALGQRYLEQAAPMAGDTPYFIDKYPQNAIYLGPIHSALPRAKIVLVERSPMDACFSMFKQVFTDSFPFSYNLDELADYYISYQAVMQHWRLLLGDRIHVVHYEELVKDQEAVTRRLLDFCELEFEPSCMEFHSSTAPVITASASQVRQAIYSSSVGNWLNYRERLKPLEEKLRAAGCVE
jgi:hypothetical protein